MIQNLEQLISNFHDALKPENVKNFHDQRFSNKL